MYRSRVIPCLLLNNRGLYKTVRFKNPQYLGDPINSLKLFNDKEADEIIILDIGVSQRGEEPNFEYIKRLTKECFMPICYGGGVSSIKHIETLFRLGVEKVSLNSALFHKPEIVSEACNLFGGQSIVASIDVKKGFFGSYSVYTNSGEKNTKYSPVEYAKRAADLGVGEILLTSIDTEGTMKGYDINLIREISDAVDIPVIANGGAGKLADCVSAIHSGRAAAAAAGSLFVYYGALKAVLINYPTQSELKDAFSRE